MTNLAVAEETGALVDAVKLSLESVKGLKPRELVHMKETVLNVNSALNVSGNALRSAMQDLYELKENIDPGNWTAFLKSGVLNISQKAASDLVNAYEKWISKVDVHDYVLTSMTPRTLNALASASPEVQNKIVAKAMDGQTITEADVRKEVGVKRTKEQKALTATIKDIGDEKSGLASGASEAAEMIDEMKLEAENYQEVVRLSNLIKGSMQKLRECRLVNLKSPLIEAYESKLKAEASPKIVDREALSFMFVAKGLELPEFAEMAGTLKDKIIDMEANAAENSEKSGIKKTNQ